MGCGGRSAPHSHRSLHHEMASQEPLWRLPDDGWAVVAQVLRRDPFQSECTRCMEFIADCASCVVCSMINLSSVAKQIVMRALARSHCQASKRTAILYRFASTVGHAGLSHILVAAFGQASPALDSIATSALE